MSDCVRIGNAQGFWGDAADAPATLLAQQPNLDYLTLDYLAEISLGIMAAQQQRDPSLGYARDFVDVVRSLVPAWREGSRCRVVTNAGGLNPTGCAEACAAALRELDCGDRRIGIVHGDNVLDLVRAAHDPFGDAYRNLETGAAIGDVLDRLVTANAYLGARPVAEALAAGADIVITGRVADPSLVAGPAAFHFGWHWEAYSRLAGALVAGHLIECGAQVTGGILTNWLDVPDLENIGFPYVELFEDGSCVVTKPEESGGCVTLETVKEQLFYEIGNPGNYLSPDATVTMLDIRLAEEGSDRIRVTRAKGSPPTDSYKVSATYQDGYWAQGTLTVYGRDALLKAKRCGEIVRKRLLCAGFELERFHVECLGTGACSPGMHPEPELLETVLRIGVADPRKEAVDRFSRELAPLITSGPQGVTGFSAGRPASEPGIRVLAVFDFKERSCTEDPVYRDLTPYRIGYPQVTMKRSTARKTARLGEIAHARSGDKGSSATLGVFAYTDAGYRYLAEYLTADVLMVYFEPMGCDGVDRYEIPKLNALNFVLSNVLAGGGSRSLRIDAQGKAIGQIALELLIEIPEETFERCLSAGGNA